MPTCRTGLPCLLALALLLLLVAPACQQSPPPPPAPQPRSAQARPVQPKPQQPTPGPVSANSTRIDLTFSGGHDTDPRDHGRPVALVAGGLGVPPDVFRAAFSHVTPAPAGTAPDPAQVQRNKAALLGALSQYGVDNALLDKVSDYYRYNASQGELWPVVPATGFADIRDGKVALAILTSPGAGYTTPPTVAVPGYPDVKLVVELSFSKDLSKNGSLVAIAAK